MIDKITPETCDHEWDLRDESFDHPLGTETVLYYECEFCGATKELEPGDYGDPFEDCNDS